MDLVRHQIEIAAGSPLALAQDDLSMRGHAIECRIYAEDPEQNFMPSPGAVTFLQEPSGPGIRNDCGVYSGVEVPMEYDPIISKLVVHAETREASIQRMVRALETYTILGVKTPISFLLDVLESQPFADGATYTDFIDTHFADWAPNSADLDLAALAWVADAMAPGSQRTTTTVGQVKHTGPWQSLANWRL